MSAVADVLRRLTVAFTEFEGRLEQTPLIRTIPTAPRSGAVAMATIGWLWTLNMMESIFHVLENHDPCKQTRG